jgi:hypothetical protein
MTQQFDTVDEVKMKNAVRSGTGIEGRWMYRVDKLVEVVCRLAAASLRRPKKRACDLVRRKRSEPNQSTQEADRHG